jgi:hypothetical protein
MSVLMVRSKVKPESVTELDAAVGRVFAAIREAQPEGIRYASFRLADGVTYVALLQVDDGVENPVPGLPEFRDLQERLEGWVAEPPAAGPATVVGSYRLLD